MRYPTSLVLALALFAAPAFGKGASHSSSRASSSSHAGHVAVSGHTTKKGTSVQSYHRTPANKTQRDNWSTKGNVNPDTGKPGTKRAKR
jgi:hypothetical protein